MNRKRVNAKCATTIPDSYLFLITKDEYQQSKTTKVCSYTGALFLVMCGVSLAAASRTHTAHTENIMYDTSCMCGDLFWVCLMVGVSHKADSFSPVNEWICGQCTALSECVLAAVSYVQSQEFLMHNVSEDMQNYISRKFVQISSLNYWFIEAPTLIGRVSFGGGVCIKYVLHIVVIVN